MERANEVSRSSPPQKRKHRRFSLRYPVRLKVHSADLMVEFDAVSRNISVGGLLMETSSMIPQHTPVSFIVSVEDALVVHRIQFEGEGKVVRVEPQGTESTFAIAVECQRPITQINAHLAPTGS